ncbi:DUF1932 domain-containing protein [Agrobacterium sp. CCNWLW71]|uniref:NAD(P)-dependent oxidoreductase n=1 Tax=unclassified Agrobacterium TaxID=2632611 RepID=UPI002FF14968
MAEIAGAFPQMTFVGFGEASHAIASSWTFPDDSKARAYDLKLNLAVRRSNEKPAVNSVAGCSQKTDAEGFSDSMSRLVEHHCCETGVEAFDDLAQALKGASVILCLVTADMALEAARSSALHLDPGALWLDGNSCAPQTKQVAAELIEAAGGHYVDVALMAPVYPKRHQVPLLLSGPHAQEADAFLRRLGMAPKIAGSRIGDASSIKMLRSVMIKGFEALTTECLLAARRAGVADAVIASLQASDPGIDWRARGAYNLDRMLVHGLRRAAEAEEVCATLAAYGLPDWMSRGTVEWQRRMGSLGLDSDGNGALGTMSDGLTARADKVLNIL